MKDKLDMGFFLSNGNDIDLSRLKAGLAVNSNNEFLKHYDKNKNSIFEQEEIDKIKQDIEAQDVNADGQIDRTEAMNWAKALDIAQTKINELFSGNKNAVDDGLETLVSEQAKADAAAIISRDADTTLNIYFKSKKSSGEVAKEWDNFKQLAGLVFDVEYAGNKVYRQLINKKVTGVLLEEAQKGGLSRADYINIKIGHLINLLGVNGMSQKERDKIKQSILNMELLEVETMIEKLSNAEDGEYQSQAKKFVSELANPLPANKHKDLVGGKKIKTPLRAILESGLAEKNISFEQIFKKEMGVEYDEQAIQNYMQKEQKLQILATINNSIVNVNNKLSNVIEEAENHVKNSQQSGFETNPAEYEKLNLAVLSALKEVYGNNEERISEELTKLLGRNVEINNGLIDLGRKNFTELAEIARKVQNSLVSRLKNILGGKTIEQYQQELKESYTMAYGLKNPIDLAQGYAQNQKDGVMYAKFGAQALGFGMMLVSGGSLMAVGAGMLTATGGSVGISAVEAYTKEGGATEEDKAAIKEELITAIKLLPAGIGVGMVATKIGAQFTSRIAQLIGNYGSDLVMSVLVDMTIMGDVDLSAEGISELMNIFMGVAAHHKVKGAKNRANTAKTEPNVNVTNKSDQTVYLGKREGVDGVVVKIGEEEYIIKDMSELQPLLKEKAPNSKKVDMRGLELQQDLLAQPTLQEIPQNIKQSYSNADLSAGADGRARANVPKSLSDNFSDESIQKLYAYLAKHPSVAEQEISLYMEAIGNITEQIKSGVVPSKKMLHEATKNMINKIEGSSYDDIYDVLLDGITETKELDRFTDYLCGIKNVTATDNVYKQQYAEFMTDLKNSATPSQNKQTNNSGGSEIQKSLSDNYSEQSIQQLSAFLEKKTTTPDVYKEAICNITEQIKNGVVPSKSMLDKAVEDIMINLNMDLKHNATAKKEIASNLRVAMSQIDELNEFVSFGFFMKDLPNTHPRYKKTYDKFMNNLKKADGTPTDIELAQQAKKDRGEAYIKAKQEAEAKAKQEAEAKAQEAAEAKAKKEAEEKALREQEHADYEKYSEKYPEIFEKMSDKSAIALSKIVESYDLKMSYENFEPTKIYNCLSSAGVPERDWDNAFAYIKNKFHKDVIEIEQRVEGLTKPLGKNDSFTLSKENARIADLVSIELKAREEAGIKITENEIDEMIENVMIQRDSLDVRMLGKIKQRLFNIPELQKYLNDNLHLNIYNNSKYTEMYDKTVIEDAVKVLDIVKQDAQKGTLSIDDVRNAVNRVKDKNLIDNRTMSPECVYALHDIIADDPELSILCKGFLDQITMI